MFENKKIALLENRIKNLEKQMETVIEALRNQSNINESFQIIIRDLMKANEIKTK